MRFVSVVLLSLISLFAFGQTQQGLRFIENKGQWERGSDFQAQVPGGRLGVSATGFSVFLVDLDACEHQHIAGDQQVGESDWHAASESVNAHYFQINLLGSNPDAKPVSESLLDGYDNYFLGNNSSQWVTKARSFASILYKDVYKGIDFRVSSVGKNLKYDFIVSPGADPSQIKIEYKGVDGVEK